MSEEEKEIYYDIHADYDYLTSGYSTISSNKGEFSMKKHPPINIQLGAILNSS
jgi:hypothetical protein